MEVLGCVLAAGALGAAAAEPPPAPARLRITPFSDLRPGGALPREWRRLRLPNWKEPEYTLVADGGVAVLRSHVDSAAGSLAHALDDDPREHPVLAWRWKVDRVIEQADFTTRSGDDFAARVYVYYDVPRHELSVPARAKLALAELLSGMALPTATICYVWDNKHPVGTSAWSAYTDRVRIVVLQSGNAKAGRWQVESRDLEADFRAAFAEHAGKPTPRVKGIAVGNDTDQTHESATAWFGDFRLEARK